MSSSKLFVKVYDFFLDCFVFDRGVEVSVIDFGDAYGVSIHDIFPKHIFLVKRYALSKNLKEMEQYFLLFG